MPLFWYVQFCFLDIAFCCFNVCGTYLPLFPQITSPSLLCLRELFPALSISVLCTTYVSFLRELFPALSIICQFYIRHTFSLLREMSPALCKFTCPFFIVLAGAVSRSIYLTNSLPLLYRDFFHVCLRELFAALSLSVLFYHGFFSAGGSRELLFTTF